MNHIPESPVAIVGSRDYPDLEQVRAFVRSLPDNACVISGGAKGVDQAAESEAQSHTLKVLSLRPKKVIDKWLIQRVSGYKSEDRWISQVWMGRETFRTFSEAAHVRNSMIVNNAASVVAFWDGQSKGTKSTIDKAKAAGILFAVYGPESVTLLPRIVKWRFTSI